MTLTYEVMRLARTGGQRMVVYRAAPGSPDEQAVLRLEPARPRDGAATPAGRPEPAARTAAPLLGTARPLAFSERTHADL